MWSCHSQLATFDSYDVLPNMLPNVFTGSSDSVSVHSLVFYRLPSGSPTRASAELALATAPTLVSSSRLLPSSFSPS